MRSFAIAAILGLIAAPAVAEGAGRPVLVELFTSQGCSSCPPADRFLTELAQSRGDVLALAFHVTYWNYLGWRDPFSFEGATERQSSYAAQLGESSVFTPQMIVDGSRSVIGSSRGEATQAIQSAKAGDENGAAVTVNRQGDHLEIHVGRGAGGSARVLLVGFDREHTTAVARGENGGRTLTDTNVVRAISTVGSWTGPALTLSVAPPPGDAAAVLVQAADGRIIGAARLAS